MCVCVCKCMYLCKYVCVYVYLSMHIQTFIILSHSTVLQGKQSTPFSTREAIDSFLCKGYDVCCLHIFVCLGTTNVINFYKYYSHLLTREAIDSFLCKGYVVCCLHILVCLGITNVIYF